MDAVGARLTLKSSSEPTLSQIRSVRAGDGFLSQSSAWNHFGLGPTPGELDLNIAWPGGETQTLTGIKASGWVWTDLPSMAIWAGNKAPITSDTAQVAPKDFFAQRFAGGHDLAREYYDFNVTEIIDSYVQAMVDWRP